MNQWLSSRSRLTDGLFLLIILFLYSINVYLLAAIDFEPPKWDEAVHLRDSLIFHTIISNPSHINLDIVRDMIDGSLRYLYIRPSGYYPPFAPVVTSLFYPVFGTSFRVAVMSNMVFLALLVFSIYGIGTSIMDRNPAILASLLVLLSPIILKHSVVYMLDLPLAAMVAVSILVLIKSDHFKNTKFSIVFGFLFGFGMLTKWTYLFFVVGPLCYELAKALYAARAQSNLKENYDRGKAIRNIGFSIAVSAATFGPYYFPILPILLKKTVGYSHGVLAAGPNSRLSVDSVIFYPVALWRQMATPFGFALFVSGMVLLAWSRNSYKKFLTVCLCVPYLVFTFVIQNKQPRFMMPWLASVSLIASFCIYAIQINKVGDTLQNLFRNARTFGTVVMVVFMAILFVRQDMRLEKSIKDRSKENWQINEMVSVLKRDMEMSLTEQDDEIVPYVGVIPDHYYVNGQTISYYVALRGLRLNVIKLENYKGTAYHDFVKGFEKYDYIVTKEFGNTPLPSFQDSINTMHRFFYSKVEEFDHLETFHEPDGSEVAIFKRM